MFKSVVLSALASLALLAAPLASASAGDVTVSCAGSDRHMETTVAPRFGPRGALLGNLEPTVVAARCVQKAGSDVFVLDIPGKPTFATLDAAKALIRHIANNGATLQNGRAES